MSKAEDRLLTEDEAHAVWKKAWHKDKKFNYYESARAVAKAQDAQTAKIVVAEERKALGEWLEASVLAEFEDEANRECVSLYKKVIEALKRGERPGEKGG